MKTPKMMKHGVLRLPAFALFLGMALGLLSSCGMMDDDNDYCATVRRVYFIFERNMLFTDALGSQVERITLCAYSGDTLAYRRQVAVSALKRDTAGYYLTLSDLPSGHYTLQVWAEGPEREAGSLEYGENVVGNSPLDAHTARLSRDERQTIAHDVTPLYHGLTANVDMTDYDYRGVRSAKVFLTKDTNVFRIVLQNLSGDSIATGDFDFRITDRNGYLAADNSLLPDSLLTYTPWALNAGRAGIGSADNETVTGVSTVVAELTTGRLIAGRDMRLIVTRRDDGKQIVNIPLIDYCLLVKGNYNRSMSDQEYLDRQDAWDLVFFIDNNREWMSASIYVQQWRIVLQNADL